MGQPLISSLGPTQRGQELSSREKLFLSRQGSRAGDRSPTPHQYEGQSGCCREIRPMQSREELTGPGPQGRGVSELRLGGQTASTQNVIS